MRLTSGPPVVVYQEIHRESALSVPIGTISEDFSSEPGFESEFHVVASTSGPSIRIEIVAQNKIDVLHVQNC
jgi:hypothetical protein